MDLFGANASMAAMTAIALCRLSLPLSSPSFATHQASANAGAAQR
jgi:hypothetical protein